MWIIQLNYDRIWKYIYILKKKTKQNQKKTQSARSFKNSYKIHGVKKIKMCPIVQKSRANVKEWDWMWKRWQKGKDFKWNQNI